MTLKVILPDTAFLDPDKLVKVINNGLTGAAKGAQVDFKTTTLTWQHSVTFEIVKESNLSQTVGTDDDIYTMVNDGTKPHLITGNLSFQAGYKAKTSPGVIGSRNGGPFGDKVFAHMVHHPGTKARDFDEVIQKKWDEQLPVILQRAIDSEFD